MLNDSIRYEGGQLTVDGVPVSEIIAAAGGTPLYLYSERRILENYRRIAEAFSAFHAHIHYSAKANANLAILRALIRAGAGIDAVSAGEIYRALTAGALPEQMVFAGVGKTSAELRYALEQRIGWFNVENIGELQRLDALAAELNCADVRVALRLNPDVTADTHPYIATGHGGAKFGLTADAVAAVLEHQRDYPRLQFAGIHVHIGSQLHNVSATAEAIRKAVDLIAPYPQIQTVNIGGGFPVAYQPGEVLPALIEFAAALHPLLKDYQVILEPGRSIVADAGLLAMEVLYIKRQAGEHLAIVDAGMSEIIRPALYQAHHEITPLSESAGEMTAMTVVGPVCESGDVLRHGVVLPSALQPGDRLALLTAGAYGMVMASHYNARPRPAEVMVLADGSGWQVIRRRETWQDLLQAELDG